MRTVLQLVLVLALGLVLSGAAHAWGPAACAQDCAEETRGADSAEHPCDGETRGADCPEDGCDDEAVPCGPECLACPCSAPAWGVPALAPLTLSSPAPHRRDVPASSLGGAEDGVVRGVFQPPRRG
jgi:hypothetical protein